MGAGTNNHYPNSYGELISKITGGRFGWFPQIFIFINSLGQCIAAVYTPAIVYTQSACKLDYTFFCNIPIERWRIIILCSFLITSPFSLVEDLGKFRYINGAFFTMFIVCFVVLQSDMIQSSTAMNNEQWNETSPRIFSFTSDYKGYLKFLGLVAFAMENIPMILPIRSVSKQPRKFNNTLISVACAIFLASIALGITSYIRFGSTLKEMLFEMYFDEGEKKILPFSSIGLYSFILYLNMPSTFYPVYEIFKTNQLTPRLTQVI